MNHEPFKSWLDAYGRAWETRDPHAAVDLFRAFRLAVKEVQDGSAAGPGQNQGPEHQHQR